MKKLLEFDGQLRLPPHSIEAEQSVLGGLLLDNTAWERVESVVLASDFYRADHRLIFEHIVHLLNRDMPADVITVHGSLVNAGASDSTGGLPYLNALAQNTPSAANVRHYAEMVQTRSILRQMIGVGYEIAESALEPAGRETSRLLDEAESKVLAIAEEGPRSERGFVDVQPFLTQVIERIDELYHRDSNSGITGVATGFADLDERTAGLQPGELVVIAGRPSMGKTAFAINIAEHVAIEKGLTVAIFSMEMAGAQLAMRMVGSLGSLDQHVLRTGKLRDDDWPRLTHAIAKLQDAKLFIDETASLDPYAIRSRARRLMRKRGKLGLIVIDYIQLISGNARASSENRATEVAEITRALKGLAKEMKCPVIALSQLNRAVDQRPNKRPLMSDLRESGAIEQDADLILFIYRDEFYNPDSMDRGTAEIIIAKQRNGPIGTVRLGFEGRYTRFNNSVVNS